MRRGTLAAYWVTSFLAGSALLTVEMTATRALAPFFGQAQFVWANVIGLMLAGLALGNMVGGRLADRRGGAGVLGVFLLFAAALVVFAAFSPPIVARWILPPELSLEVAYPFLLKGSFLTTAACFVPPVVALGAITPLTVRCASDTIETVGTRTGSICAAGTIGSIAATFLTTHVLVPTFGTRGTLLLAAGTLAVAAAIPLSLRGRKGAAGLVLAIGCAAGIGATAPSIRAATPGAAFGDLIAARESRYQHLEIRERRDLPKAARVLAIDEGHDSVQSVTPHEGVLTGGLYYDYLNLLALDASRSGALSIAILGFGGGTHARQLLEIVGPKCRLTITGVELDAEAVAMGRDHLGLRDDPRLSVLTDLDARTFVDHGDRLFDLIYVDCYERQSFIPTHVASIEFFRAALRRLEPDGVLALNLFGYGARDPVVVRVCTTLARAADRRVALMPLPQTANLLAWTGGRATRLPTRWDASGWSAECAALAEDLRSRPGQFFWVDDPKGVATTDDDGSFDALQYERLAAHSERLLSNAR